MTASPKHYTIHIQEKYSSAANPPYVKYIFVYTYNMQNQKKNETKNAYLYMHILVGCKNAHLYICTLIIYKNAHLYMYTIK